MRLQRALRDSSTVPMVLEVVLDSPVAYDPARGGDVALLHGEHDVVLQGLGRSLNQDVVGREPGRADAVAPVADDVFYLVGQATEALSLWDGLQVCFEGGLYFGHFAFVELADSGTAPELP